MAYIQKNDFFKRFFSGVGAVFTGILVVIIGVILLSWNEANSVKVAKAIKDADSIKVQLDEPKFDAENNNKLVAVMGGLTYTAAASDPLWNVNGSFVIERVVEVYQYRERKQGSSTDKEEVYTAAPKWVSSHESSAGYKDRQSIAVNNVWPAGERFRSYKSYANDVRLGDFRLGSAQLSNLRASTAVVPAGVPAGLNGYSVRGVYITNQTGSAPKINDVRVSFYKSDATQISVLARQNATGTFGNYDMKNGLTMNRAYEGLLTGSEIVKRLSGENAAATRVLRIIFTIGICIGFSMFFTPLTVLAASIPFLGGFFGKLSQGIAGIIGAVVGIALSLLVIAISWVVVRPLIGIPLLIIAIALMVGAVSAAKNKKSA